jgi:hypothetical protein
MSNAGWIYPPQQVYRYLFKRCDKLYLGFESDNTVNEYDVTPSPFSKFDLVAFTSIW